MQNKAEVIFPGHVFKLRTNQIGASGAPLFTFSVKFLLSRMSL